eukprot:TRINITY_DN116438_c0_g1_i1.p1 TRINITY_DN116438_c0_g1~~TRINITY_DN116438_c0_g1_i1.p1  ORF type:complete len:132 (+),score=8.73 TRINITY_DN116438_c0_g1_i1:104-499(+)
MNYSFLVLAFCCIASVVSAAECDSSCSDLCQSAKGFAGAMTTCNKLGSQTCDGACKTYFDKLNGKSGEKCWSCTLLCGSGETGISYNLPSEVALKAIQVLAKCATKSKGSSVFASIAVLVTSLFLTASSIL